MVRLIKGRSIISQFPANGILLSLLQGLFPGSIKSNAVATGSNPSLDWAEILEVALGLDGIEDTPAYEMRGMSREEDKKPDSFSLH